MLKQTRSCTRCAHISLTDRFLKHSLLSYKLLTTASLLATYANETELSTAWSKNATALKTVFNEALWVPEVGLYRDNTSTTLTPQDANSFAVLFNITMNQSQAEMVSEGLTRNWVELGPVPPGKLHKPPY